MEKENPEPLAAHALSSEEAGGTTAHLFAQRFSGGLLRKIVDGIHSEVGNNAELAKQALSEFYALDRQLVRDHFEGRLEYTRHMMARRDTTDRGMVEYGLQTLKWLFLLNAGGIALVMAYIGTATGKSGGSIAVYAPVIRELWPFAAGCVAVTFAGAAGYFNFCYAEATLPSPEGLNNFLAPSAAAWPLARLQKSSESPQAFTRRFGWKVAASRIVAIGFALAAALFFATGVLFVMQAALA